MNYLQEGECVTNCGKQYKRTEDSENGKTCTLCESPDIYLSFNKDECINYIPTGYYVSTEENETQYNILLKCNETCVACQDKANHCTECSIEKKIKNNTCVESSLLSFIFIIILH